MSEEPVEIITREGAGIVMNPIELRVKKRDADRPQPFALSSGVGRSGPVTVARNEESFAIQAAPAYDLAKARRCIDNFPLLRERIAGVESGASLKTFGTAAPDGVLCRLSEEILRLSKDNHKVSLIMANLAACSGVAWQPAIPMCAQSTIKAIYVYSLIDWRPAAIEENGRDMREAIVYSSNAAYERLRTVYGNEPIRIWCRDAGVDPAFAEPLYPRERTAQEMFMMWMRLFAFLNGGKDKNNFGAYLADTSASASRKRLGNRYPVQSKAGWECGLREDRNYDPSAIIPERFTDGDPANDECAINDSGVVYTEEGPCLFVVYTDHPFGIFRDYVTVNPLYDLMEALCAVHKGIAMESDKRRI